MPVNLGLVEYRGQRDLVHGHRHVHCETSADQPLGETQDVRLPIGYECPHCGELVEIFGRGGGETLAKELELPFLGYVPLDPTIREAGDVGEPTVSRTPDSPAGQALTQVAEALTRVLDGGQG